MTAVAGHEVIYGSQVVIGVDTHQDGHVAVAIDQQGVRPAGRYAPATRHGYGEIERWSRKLGEIRAFGLRALAPTAPDLPGSSPAGASPPSRSTGLTGQPDTGRVRATPPMRRWQHGRFWPE